MYFKLRGRHATYRRTRKAVPICDGKQDYSIVFILNDQPLFSVSAEERIVTAKVVDLAVAEVNIRGTAYHGQLLFVIDEHLCWSLFAFGKAEQPHKQRFRQVLSSREVGLFDYVQELSNKQRKGLKCIVNALRLSKQRLVLSVQLNLCPGHTSYIQFDTNQRKQTTVKPILKDYTDTTGYQHILKGKEIVNSVISLAAPEMEQTPLLKREEFYTKIVVVKDPATDSLSLYTFMVERTTYGMHVGKNILLNLEQPIIQLFFVAKLYTVVLCVPGALVLYNLHNNSSKTHQLEYSSVVELQNGTLLTANSNSGICMMLQLENQLTFTAKVLFKDLKKCQRLIAVSNKLTGFYMMDSEGSIQFLKASQGKIQSMEEVYHNHESKVLSVRNLSNRFGGLLSITKRVGQINQTFLLSNQPHAHIHEVIQHNIGSLELSEVIPVDGSTLILTNPNMGTVFIDCIIQEGRLVVRNNQDYQRFEVKEQTLMFKRSQSQTVQVTETKIIVQQKQSIKVVETRALFDNMNIALDGAVLLNNQRVLGLLVREQLHLFSLANGSLQALFIYCFDEEIEKMFVVSDHQLLAVKLFGSNSLDFYFVDLQEETLQRLNSIDHPSELHVKEVHSFPVQINTQHYLVSLVGRLHDTPLLLFAPNESINKRCKEVVWCEFKTLPLDYCRQFVRVHNHHETDKHVFLSRDLYVSFPKSCIVEGDVTALPVYCLCSNRTNNTIEQPLWVASSSKTSLYAQLGRKSIVVWEDKVCKVNQPQNFTTLEGYNVQIEIEQVSASASTLHINAYGQAELTNPLSDQNFGKITSIKTIASSISVQEQGTTFPRRIACIPVQGLPIRGVKWLKGPILLLCSTDEVWLSRLQFKANRFCLTVYSRFSLPNDAFLSFQNKLPRSDLDNPLFMAEFKKRHTIVQLQSLDCSKQFTMSSNYLLLLFKKNLLVLQLDRMVFKIHQTLEMDEQIESILDNFRPGSVYARGSNYLYLLSADTNGKYKITRQQQLDDTIVFASTIDDWLSKWRCFRASSGQSLPISHSTIIVKQLGQLQVCTTDRHGLTTESEMYV